MFTNPFNDSDVSIVSTGQRSLWKNQFYFDLIIAQIYRTVPLVHIYKRHRYKKWQTDQILLLSMNLDQYFFILLVAWGSLHFNVIPYPIMPPFSKAAFRKVSIFHIDRNKQSVFLNSFFNLLIVYTFKLKHTKSIKYQCIMEINNSDLI